MPTSFLLVLTTLPKRSDARRLGRLLLEKKAAACVNLLGPADSSLWWKGKIDHAREYLLLIKTRTSVFSKLRRLLEKNHPYDVPEIVALRIERGNAPYLDWIKRSLRG
jgi:periplasmic divalent cation tolerance protein